MNNAEKMEILKGLESINPYDFNDCDGNPFEVVREQIENKDDVWNIIKYLLGEIEDLNFLVSEREKKYEELELKYRSIVGYGSDKDRAYETDDDGYTTEELRHFINRLEDIEKQKTLDGFVDICKNGTSKECRTYVQEAKRHGISYDELCEYKRQKREG